MHRDRRSPDDQGSTQSAALNQALQAEAKAQQEVEQARQQAELQLEKVQADARARLQRLPRQVARLHAWAEKGLQRQLRAVADEEAAELARLEAMAARPVSFDDLIEDLAARLSGRSG